MVAVTGNRTLHLAVSSPTLVTAEPRRPLPAYQYYHGHGRLGLSTVPGSSVRKQSEWHEFLCAYPGYYGAGHPYPRIRVPAGGYPGAGGPGPITGSLRSPRLRT
eukprot:1481337-Rhodomonas_salina.2